MFIKTYNMFFKLLILKISKQNTNPTKKTMALTEAEDHKDLRLRGYINSSIPPLITSTLSGTQPVVIIPPLSNLHIPKYPSNSLF